MEKHAPELPEYLREMLEKGELADTISLDREGNWTHNGEKIANEKIASFFSRSVARTDDGTYVISYGDHVYPITVEDAPVFVTGVLCRGFGIHETIRLTLSTGEEEDLDIDSLSYGKDNALYCTVRQGTMPAKFRRSPSFELLERLDENCGRYYLTLCGKRIHLQQKGES